MSPAGFKDRLLTRTEVAKIMRVASGRFTSGRNRAPRAPSGFRGGRTTPATSQARSGNS